jgi:hypothetical protein
VLCLLLCMCVYVCVFRNRISCIILFVSLELIGYMSWDTRCKGIDHLIFRILSIPALTTPLEKICLLKSTTTLRKSIQFKATAPLQISRASIYS